MHPTLFELDGFVRRGSTSAEFERHVSDCDACAQRLSGLALRADPAALVRDEPSSRRFQAAAVALAACLAVLLVRTVPVLPMPNEARAPEGVHGTTPFAPSGVEGPDVMMILADAGPTDSGVR
ncbi:MAG: hypothetical protein Q8L48_40160 [Archangium sp.]|nr:hypothetical protein [Archangium sp.]